MNDSQVLSRRRFLQSGFLVTACMTGSSLFGAPNEVIGSDRGLKLGMTTYSLRKFNLDQALAMTQEAKLKYISLKDMHLPLTSSQAERIQTRDKVKAAGLELMGGGVIYLKDDEDQIRHAFQYAQDAGMPTIICSPEPSALDIVEKYAKQFKIRIAIHNHGPGDKHYPSPLDALEKVKDRDQLMGLCIDIGHTVRNGEEPVSVIKKCASRLYDFHMKDVTRATANGKTIAVGKGVIDIAGVLRTLVQIKFDYHLALEYEADSSNPMPGIKESIQYIRRVLKEI
jgi:inosose dehydratase